MAVCSILYQLATRPEQQEKLYKELVKILPDANVSLTTKHLDQMVFLKGFVREVFRCVKKTSLLQKLNIKICLFLLF